MAVNYRKDKEIVDKLIKEIKREYKMEAIGVCADISEENDVERIFNEIEESISPVNILVNNTAVSPTLYIKDTELDV